MAAIKSSDAFLTIGELSDDLGVPQHVLRYWEGRFPQLKPLQRAGNRRYYRPADVVLAKRIHRLLTVEGYTVRGVQKLLASTDPAPAGEPASPKAAVTSQSAAAPELSSSPLAPAVIAELRAIRNALATALERG